MKKGFANRVSRKEMDNFKPKLVLPLARGTGSLYRGGHQSGEGVTLIQHDTHSSRL